jgi:hypothetical protein
MGSEIPPLPVDRGEQTAEQPESQPAAALDTNRDVLFSQPADKEDRSLHWIFFGEEGLRAGWSLAIFLCLIYGMGRGLKFALAWWHVKLPHGSNPISPETAFVGELIQLLVLLAAAWIVSRIERRKVLDYNLRGPRPLARFGSGLITGFVALSVLIAGLSAGGWLHFGGVALSGSQIALYAAEWAAVFLLVGCLEEGLTRCYLLFTLARGLNFWWGLGLVAGICVLFSLNAKANGLWGAYAIALLGLVPCLFLHVRKAPSAGFWNAAWVTSVMFGGGHTSNGGENWVGIFAAAGIGLVFCASVRLTGSAWWAIGCHAAWDWGESFFYGTQDSGMIAKGHLLTTAQAGNPLWNGGADGPEGSLLTIPVILLLLLVLLVQYRRSKDAAVPTAAEQPVAG